MYELATLGLRRLRTVDDAGRVAADLLLFRRPKHFALLTYLSIQNGSLCPRDLLLPLLWPDSDEAHARNALSKTLGRIRAELGAGVLRAVGSNDVGLQPGSIRVDVETFRLALREQDWARAMDVYGGDFLAGFHLRGARAFANWVEDVRAQLRGEAIRAALRLSEQQQERHDLPGAAVSLRRALALAPSDEAIARSLMNVLDGNGERAAALAAYRSLEQLLRAEMAAAPHPATRELAIRIQRSRALRSIAVLPWANLTGSPDQEHLCDGLTDLVITELARMRAGRIISRQSIRRLKAASFSLAEAARLLSVDAVIEGSLIRTSGNVSLTAQLIRVEPEEHLWAERFDCDVTGLADIAVRIATAVTTRVRGRAEEVSVAAPAPRRPGATINGDAYEAYLRGRHFSVMLPRLGDAIHWYGRAVQLAPTFAPAWAGLASAYAVVTLLAHASPEDIFPLFRQAVERAMQLDPDLAEANTARGLYRMLAERDWAGADRDLAMGARLAPGTAEPHAHRAMFLAAMGRVVDAHAEISLAVQLDPIGAPALFCRAWCLYKSAEHNESIRQLTALLDLHPYFSLAWTYLGLNHALLGNHDEAVDAARCAMRALPDNHEALALGVATLGVAGRAAEARAVLRRLLALDSVQYLDPWAVGVAYAGLGNIERAVQWFRRMYDEHSPSAFCVRCDPLLDRVRGQPAFQNVLRRLAFPSR